LAKGKLVRDRIPEIIRARGEEPIVHAISGEALLDALIAKLAEEGEELRSAAAGDRAEELADLMEVVRAIALHLTIDLQELEAIVASKREERGGFAGGLWLEMPSPT
jgi:predicted house-cleaning noncanonical NTP pyrophosphatase (MazG superfamily)